MSAAETTAVRNAIVATLNSVADIGVVHAFPRYASNSADMKAFYVSPTHQQLRGWHIERQSVREEGALQERTVENARWLITGLLALSDGGESFLQFDDLIEAVRDAFRFKTFDNTVALTDGQNAAYIQGEAMDQVMFGGVLCHRARLYLPVNTLLEVE